MAAVSIYLFGSLLAAILIWALDIVRRVPVYDRHLVGFGLVVGVSLSWVSATFLLVAFRRALWCLAKVQYYNLLLWWLLRGKRRR